MPTTNTDIYFETSNVAANARLNFTFLTDAKIRLSGRANDADGFTVFAISDDPVATETWVHVAAVYNGPAERSTIYINGVENIETAIANKTFTNAASNGIAIGGNPTTSVRFIGQIDDLRIYNAALLPVDIRHVMIGQQPQRRYA